ncbi:hypothetical protein [Myxococcus sp. CA040A]|uniref:hypothetical protein n=1 Tax=Myxococcus sp. CA040A TaxID=2741738 RepID=UPI00157ACCAD|nr:hypothetical protein [Myxococcus sp. CA040A]NTX08013.1 hypothetical protein [Myxococcus sp. CA040A]
MAHLFKTDEFTEFSEMYWAGPTALEVVTGNRAIQSHDKKLASNHFRIWVLERAKPGQMDRFTARYEWLVNIRLGDHDDVPLWADATTELPSADGQTVEDCISMALGSITGALMQRGVDEW